MKEEYKLSHLKELEAESIHIIREVAAEFENPVMLYSIGKDSSVMVRLAEKAFYPGKVPFPLMHIDSKWKFKEMIQFRDEYAKKYGWNLIVESNMEAFHAGVGPFTHGSKVHTDLMKTQALLHALDKYKFDAAFGGARRDEEKSRAKERIFSFRDKLIHCSGCESDFLLPKPESRSHRMLCVWYPLMKSRSLILYHFLFLFLISTVL